MTSRVSAVADHLRDPHREAGALQSARGDEDKAGATLGCSIQVICGVHHPSGRRAQRKPRFRRVHGGEKTLARPEKLADASHYRLGTALIGCTPLSPLDNQVQNLVFMARATP
jgi:hypothetical protein